MRVLDLFNDHRITGLLLILAFILFAIGGTLPVAGEKGNSRIFTLPAREHLEAVARNEVVWFRANIFMGIAGFVLLAGLSLLTTILERANEHTFSRLGLVSFILATVLWVIFSAFRAVVTIRAAQEMNSTGAVPVYYEPLARWGFALFYIYAVIGFLALVAYGISLIQAVLLPAWTGWATLIFSIVILIQLFITGDTLPAFHYVPTLLIGILLLVRG